MRKVWQSDPLQYLDRLKDMWFNPMALWFVIAGVSVTIVPPVLSEDWSAAWKVGIVLASVGASSLLWYATSRIPKTTKGHFGIVLSISVGSDSSAVKARDNFYDELKQLVRQQFPGQFQVVLVPEYYALQYAESGKAADLMRSARGHFCVVGRCKAGKIQGEDNYAFQLKATVGHNSRNEKARKELRQDFAEMFPHKMLVPYENDLAGFEIAAVHMGLVAKYICGFAALVSHNVKVARTLFESIPTQAPSGTPSKVSSLVAKAQEKRALCYAIEITMEYQKYRRHKDADTFQLIRQLALRLATLQAPKEVIDLPHRTMAVWHFWNGRDIASSKAELQRCTHRNNVGWLLSDAFLDAYVGNLQRAHTSYRQALKLGVDAQDISETEDFISDVLAEEPDRLCLHFASGVLAFHKGDLILAEKEFRTFLDGSVNSSRWEKTIVESYLQKILANRQQTA